MPDLSGHWMRRERGRPLLLSMMKLKLRLRVSVGILLRLILGVRRRRLLLVVMVVMVPLLLLRRWLRRLRTRFLHIIEIGIELALQHQELLPVLLRGYSMMS